MADAKKDDRMIDLFCGVGTFSLPFASRSKELAGIEIVETSIESAKRNAKDNGLDNTFFMASDARRGMKELPEIWGQPDLRSEEHTSELQSRFDLVCRLLL